MAKLSALQKLFHIAAENGKLEDFIKENINSKDEDCKNKTILHKVSEIEKSASTIDYLIKLGADIEAEDQEKWKPLHYAAKAGNLEVARCLIDRGAQIETKTKLGWTPLHTAVISDKFDIVKFLIDSGAQIEAQNAFQKTPLHLATFYNRYNVANLLIKEGAKIDARDKDGNTPLHLHARSKKVSSLNMVKLFVQHGVFLDATNDNNETPIYLANREGHKEIAKYLLEKKREADNSNPEIVSTNAPCIICMEQRGGLYVLNPCGHTSLCELCCNNLVEQQHAKCPTCRKPVKHYIKMFFQAPEGHNIVNEKT